MTGFIGKDSNFDFNEILLDKKLYKEKDENGIYVKPFRIRINKIDGFIKIYDKIRCLVLFDYSYQDIICDKIKCLISEKNDIKNSIIYNFREIRIDSYNSLPAEKILNFHNVIIVFKLVVNKNKNNCYYNIFLEKFCIKVNPIQNIFK